MYKGTSQSLQRRNGVSYIMADASPSDAMADIKDMSHGDLLSERSQLRQELAQAEQQLAVAKVTRKSARSEGARKATICARLAQINGRLREIGTTQALPLLKDAIRNTVPKETADAIFAAYSDACEKAGIAR